MRRARASSHDVVGYFRPVAAALCLLCFAHLTRSDKGETYGDYEVGRIDVISCEKFLKPKTQTFYVVSGGRNDKGHSVINVQLNFTKDVGPLMGKIRVYNLKNDKETQILTINQANLCQFSFPLKLLPFELKVDKNCVAQTAYYTNATVDIDTMARGLLGKKFFYGRFKFYLEWFSKKQTAVCLFVTAEITKKSR